MKIFNEELPEFNREIIIKTSGIGFDELTKKQVQYYVCVFLENFKLEINNPQNSVLEISTLNDKRHYWSIDNLKNQNAQWEYIKMS